MKKFVKRRTTKKYRFIALAMAVVVVFTCVSFPSPKADTVAASEETESTTARPTIGTAENVATGALVTNGWNIVSESYQGGNLGFSSMNIGKFGKLSFGSTNTYCYSAQVDVSSYTANMGSVRLILGNGLYVSTDTAKNGTRVNIEVCIRPNNDSFQYVLFIMSDDHTSINDYVTSGTVSGLEAQDKSYLYTAKYENEKVSFWVDDILIFNQVDVTKKIESGSVVLQPGFFAYNAEGNLSNIQIWGDVRETDVTDVMLINNAGENQTDSYITNKKIDVATDTRGTFENLTFGSSNNYWISADMSGTYTKEQSDIRMVLGKTDDGGSIEVGLRPCPALQTSVGGVTKDKWQLVVWKSSESNPEGQYFYVVSDVYCPEIVSEEGTLGESSYVGKATYSLILNYNDGALSIWIDGKTKGSAFYQANLKTVYSKEIGKTWNMTLQPGFHSYISNGSISNIEIWGDVTGNNAAEYMSVMNHGVDETENYFWDKSIVIKQNTRGTFEDLLFGSTQSYYLSGKVNAEYTNNQEQDLRLSIGKLSDGSIVEVGLQPNFTTDKWDTAVWKTSGDSDQGTKVSTSVGVGTTSAALSGATLSGDTYTAEFVYTIHYNNGKITVWIDGERVINEANLSAELANVTLQPGFHAYNIGGTLSDIKIWGDVSNGKNYAKSAVFRGVKDQYLSVMKSGFSATEEYYQNNQSITVNPYARGSFENVTYGSSNNYWMSVDVNATYTSLRQDLRIVIGTVVGSYTTEHVEIGIRPIDGDNLELTEEVFTGVGKWQAVIWQDSVPLNYTTGQQGAIQNGINPPSGAKLEDGVYTASYTCKVHYENGKISLWIDDTVIFYESNMSSEIPNMRLMPGFYANGVSATISNVSIWGDVQKERDVDYTYDYWKNETLSMPKDSGVVATNLQTDGTFNMDMTLSYTESYEGKRVCDGFYLGTALRDGQKRDIYMGWLPNGNQTDEDIFVIWDGDWNYPIQTYAEKASGDTSVNFRMSYDTETGDIQLWKNEELKISINLSNRLEQLATNSSITYTDFEFTPGIGNDSCGTANDNVPATVSNVRIWGDVTAGSPEYISVAQPVTMISGDISLTRTVTSMEEVREMMEADVLPASALYTIDSNLHVLDENGNGFSSLSQVLRITGYQILPIVRINDSETAAALSKSLNNMNFYDLTVISTDANLLKEARRLMPNVRATLDLTEEYANRDSLTLDDCVEIRSKVYGNSANNVYLPIALCDKEIVQKLYNLQVDVWTETADSLTKVEQYEAIMSGAVGIVSDATTDLLNLACGFSETIMTRTPELLGHRGLGGQAFGAEAPECTLESAILAYKENMKAIELDFLLTTDNVVVAMHDFTTTKTCIDEDENPVELTVEECTYDELLKTADGKEIYASKGYEDTIYNKCKIPTLEQILQEFKGKDFHLYLEVKSTNPEIVPAMKDLIEKYDMYGQCTIKTFSATVIQRMAETWPEMPVSLNANPTGMHYNGYMTYSDNADRDVMKLMSLIGKYNSYVHPQMVGYDEEDARAARIRGVNICVHGYVTEASEYKSGYLKMTFLSGYGNILTDAWKGMKEHVRAISVEDSPFVALNSVLSPSLEYYLDDVREEDVVSVEVLNGADCVNIEGGNVTFIKEGEVTLLFKCTGDFSGTPYSVYTQPITYQIVEDYMENTLLVDTQERDYTYDYEKNNEIETPTDTGILLNNLKTDGVFNMSMTLTYSESYEGEKIFDGFYLGTAVRTQEVNGETKQYKQNIYLGWLPNANQDGKDLFSVWEGENNHPIWIKDREASGDTEVQLKMSYDTKTSDLKLWKGSDLVIDMNLNDRFEVLANAQTNARVYTDFKFTPGIGNDLCGNRKKIASTVSNINVWGDVSYEKDILTVGDGELNYPITFCIGEEELLPTGYQSRTIMVDKKPIEVKHYVVGWKDSDQADATTYKTGKQYTSEFIDTKMLQVHAQFKEDDTDASKRIARFIGSIDQLDYKEAGFLLSTKDSDPQIGDGCKEVTGITKVYTGLYENVEDEATYKTAQQIYDNYSKYVFAYDIRKMPKDKTVYARAYVELSDGTKVFGDVCTIVIQ